MAFTVEDARRLSNENGFEKKVEEKIEEVERHIRNACKYGHTRTCVFSHCSDRDKSDVDLAVKEHYLKLGYTFRQTPISGGVVQTTEDICW